MGMFVNLGKTLSLLRELRGKSQARVAREAGIGKSQLSKYETGKELPKLDSLEKVLSALSVSHFEFFYTLQMVDRRAVDLGPPVGASSAPGMPLAVLPLLTGPHLVPEETDQAFTKLFTDLLVLYRRVFEQVVLSPEARPQPLGTTTEPA